jgi:hypothetical protein
MQQAKERLVESHRAEYLRAQANEWKTAQDLRSYCDAVEAVYGDQPATTEWLAWAREYIARLDPLTEPPSMPGAPEPSADALQQHLPEGWSAHGPEHGHRDATSHRF